MDRRIFSTETLPSASWRRGTTPLPFRKEADGPCRPWRVLQNLAMTQRTLASDDVIVFTDDNPVTANLYGLLHRGERRPTIVRTDPLITTPHSAWKIRYLQQCLASVDCLIVWAPAVAERYHASLGVPREIMVPLHYHHTLIGHRFPPPTRGDYLFSGGDSMRDYVTLLEAVRGLPLPVRIATRWRPPAGLSVPDNVTLASSNDAEFRALLAGARLVVLPLETDTLRTSGQQSYLNAMALGKPVIVTDLRDAPFYIEDGKTGRLVPSRAPALLRDAIEQLLDSPAASRSMAEQGQNFARPLDQEHTWSRVLAVAQQAHKRSGPHKEPPRRRDTPIEEGSPATLASSLRLRASA
jgi:glycosyltransferase involved in cell wall biosynthesis